MILPKTTPLKWQLTIGRGLINTELLHEEQGVCAPHQARQPLGLAPEGKDPETSDFENQWDLYSGKLQGCRKQRFHT